MVIYRANAIDFGGLGEHLVAYKTTHIGAYEAIKTHLLTHYREDVRQAGLVKYEEFDCDLINREGRPQWKPLSYPVYCTITQIEVTE